MLEASQFSIYCRWSHAFKALERSDYEYVLGMRMRQLKHGDAQNLLDITKMLRPVSRVLKGREVSFEGKRLVICYNPQQAEKDEHKRQEILARLVEKLKT